MSAAASCPKVIAQRLRKIGVSGPYAYQIAHGTREPSLPLTVQIANEAGLRIGLLEGATDAEVAVVTQLVARRAGRSK